MSTAHRLSVRGTARPLGGGTLATWATNVISSSPPCQHISNRVVRNVMRAGSPGMGLALVVMLLRELLWIKSGSCAGAGREWVG